MTKRLLLKMVDELESARSDEEINRILLRLGELSVKLPREEIFELNREEPRFGRALKLFHEIFVKPKRH